jgi:hypothetical protein
MEEISLVQILDKHIDQEGLAKDLLKKYAMQWVEGKLAGMDPIPGTTLDNEAIAKIVAYLKAQVA